MPRFAAILAICAAAFPAAAEIRSASCASKALAREVAAVVQLPPSYAKSPNRRFPYVIALHGLFDAVYEHAVVATDEFAERLVQLGGTADGTVGRVARTTSLPAYPANAVSGSEHVAALATSMAAFGKAVRWAIDEAAKQGDADTADLFTEVSRGADKDLWMVEAHLQGDS